MFKNSDKIVIIFIIFLSFFVIGGGYYYYFNKDKEVNEKNILQITQKDILIFQQKMDAYQQKVITEKKINQENLKKNIKTLKDLGIWKDWYEKDYEECLDAVQNSQNAVKLKLDKFLKKVEKEKNLKSFRKGLEKISKEQKKDITKKIDALAKIAKKIQEEAEKPMPFFATQRGVITLAVIYSLIPLFIFYVFSCNCQIEGNCEQLSCLIAFSYVFEIVFSFFNLLLVTTNCFKEMYKRYLSLFKVLILLLLPPTIISFIFLCILYVKECK